MGLIEGWSGVQGEEERKEANGREIQSYRFLFYNGGACLGNRVTRKCWCTIRKKKKDKGKKNLLGNLQLRCLAESLHPRERLLLPLALRLQLVQGLGLACPLQETEGLVDPVPVRVILDHVLLQRHVLAHLALVVQIGAGTGHDRGNGRGPHAGLDLLGEGACVVAVAVLNGVVDRRSFGVCVVIMVEPEMVRGHGGDGCTRRGHDINRRVRAGRSYGRGSILWSCVWRTVVARSVLSMSVSLFLPLHLDLARRGLLLLRMV